MGKPYELVVAAFRFVDKGERPVTKPPGRRRPKGAPERVLPSVKYRTEIVRLKDEEGLSFGTIAQKLGISSSTAEDAYSTHHRDRLVAAAAKGGRLPMAKYRKVSMLALRSAREL